MLSFLMDIGPNLFNGSFTIYIPSDNMHRNKILVTNYTIVLSKLSQIYNFGKIYEWHLGPDAYTYSLGTIIYYSLSHH